MQFHEESKKNQLALLEQVAHNLQDVEFDESVSEVINKAMNGRLTDLEDTLRNKPKTAFDYGKDSRSIVLTIIREAVDTTLSDFIAKNKIGMTFNEINAVTENVLEDVRGGFDNPENYWGEMHFCSECGHLMRQGYGLVDEFYCSNECLHKHYTDGQYLAMYAGLDHTDPEEVRKAEAMTSEELNESNEENDSQCYYTEWEIEN